MGWAFRGPFLAGAARRLSTPRRSQRSAPQDRGHVPRSQPCTATPGSMGERADALSASSSSIPAATPQRSGATAPSGREPPPPAGAPWLRQGVEDLPGRPRRAGLGQAAPSWEELLAVLGRDAAVGLRTSTRPESLWQRTHFKRPESAKKGSNWRGDSAASAPTAAPARRPVATIRSMDGVQPVDRALLCARDERLSLPRLGAGSCSLIAAGDPVERLVDLLLLDPAHAGRVEPTAHLGDAHAGIEEASHRHNERRADVAEDVDDPRGLAALLGRTAGGDRRRTGARNVMPTPTPATSVGNHEPRCRFVDTSLR